MGFPNSSGGGEPYLPSGSCLPISRAGSGLAFSSSSSSCGLNKRWTTHLSLVFRFRFLFTYMKAFKVCNTAFDLGSRLPFIITGIFFYMYANMISNHGPKLISFLCLFYHLLFAYFFTLFLNCFCSSENFKDSLLFYNENENET